MLIPWRSSNNVPTLFVASQYNPATEHCPRNILETSVSEGLSTPVNVAPV